MGPRDPPSILDLLTRSARPRRRGRHSWSTSSVTRWAFGTAQRRPRRRTRVAASADRLRPPAGRPRPGLSPGGAPRSSTAATWATIAPSSRKARPRSRGEAGGRCRAGRPRRLGLEVVGELRHEAAPGSLLGARRGLLLQLPVRRSRLDLDPRASGNRSTATLAVDDVAVYRGVEGAARRALSFSPLRICRPTRSAGQRKAGEEQEKLGASGACLGPGDFLTRDLGGCSQSPDRRGHGGLETTAHRRRGRRGHRIFSSTWRTTPWRFVALREAALDECSSSSSA